MDTWTPGTHAGTNHCNLGRLFTSQMMNGQQTQRPFEDIIVADAWLYVHLAAEGMLVVNKVHTAPGLLSSDQPLQIR